jgi:hypothetical protein
MDQDPALALAIFFLDLQDANKKLYIKSFSAYYFLKVHLHHFLNIKSHKEVAKQQESRFFLIFLLDDRRIQEAQKHTDPTDTQHWYIMYKLL